MAEYLTRSSSGNMREHGFHERGLPGGAGALDDHGQRPGELARRAGEIGGEAVVSSPTRPPAVEGLGDAVDQVRRLEERERLGALVGRRGRPRSARRVRTRRKPRFLRAPRGQAAACRGRA